MTSTPLPPKSRFEGKPRVCVTRRLLPATEARMRELYDAVLSPDDMPMSRSALIAAMREFDVLVPTVTDTIDAAMFHEAATGRLRLIANFGAGTDHIDLHGARAHQIVVTNTPGVFTDDTADVAIGLMIAVMRRLPESSKLIRAGQWQGWNPTGQLGFSIGGKRLAIIGMGRIGQAVAYRARAFGMDIRYHNRNRLPAAVENMFGAHYEPDIDKLVAEADILTIHCPSDPEDTTLIGPSQIAAMKAGSILINTARGKLVDYEALTTALATGHLAGAGLDVFPDEPKVAPKLFTLPNVVLLPHVGSATVEGRETAGDKVIANIRFWADGHMPPNQVIDGWV